MGREGEKEEEEVSAQSGRTVATFSSCTDSTLSPTLTAEAVGSDMMA